MEVVWITGASSGIGRALALEWAVRGARLILSARRKEALEEVAQLCRLAGSEAHVLPLDLTDTRQAARWTADAFACYGQVDVLVNNAGLGQLGTVMETTEEVERQVMEVNYFASVALTRALLPHFLERKTGSIVVISSIVGKFGLPKLAAYAAAKHALHGYFESLRQEVQSDGLRILVVSPGFIKTDVALNALGPTGEPVGENSPAQANGMPPEKVAKRILKALQGSRHHVYIGGYEIWAPRIKWFWPKLFYFTFNKLSK